MTDIAAIHALIEPEVRVLGFDLVRVKMIGGKSDPTLQVMAERPDTRQLTIDDCADLSRRISDAFDVLEADGRDPIEGAYRLEVSSPGIDRPLTRLKDFGDWAGHEVRVTLVEKMDGRQQFKGDIGETDMEGGVVSIVSGNATHLIPFDKIAGAKLTITDRLLAATAPLSADGADEFEDQDSQDEDTDGASEETPAEEKN